MMRADGLTAGTGTPPQHDHMPCSLPPPCTPQAYEKQRDAASNRYVWALSSQQAYPTPLTFNVFAQRAARVERLVASPSLLRTWTL